MKDENGDHGEPAELVNLHLSPPAIVIGKDFYRRQMEAMHELFHKLLHDASCVDAAQHDAIAMGLAFRLQLDRLRQHGVRPEAITMAIDVLPIPDFKDVIKLRDSIGVADKIDVTNLGNETPGQA